MTHVHYKFSSKLSYDTVVFDGPHITLRDLKRQIMGREKLRAGDCDLQITNAQTKEEYTDDDGLIPKGSSVIVRRIPIIGPKSSSNSKTRNIERSDVQLQHPFGIIKAMDDQSSSSASPLFSKMANLADADVSEEDKIRVMMNQAICESMNYNKKPGAALPANYTCYRCGNTGHHIRNCPTSVARAEQQDKNLEAPLRLKKSTGIPRSFMVEVDDPNIKGVMLTKSGHYAIPAIHAKAYAIGKKEKPPFILEEQLESEKKEAPVPNELRCLICCDLLNDAVVIPCCGNSYCDDCIRTALLDSENHVCPTCGQWDTSPDTLIANKFLRQAVNTFMKDRGPTKSLTERRGASQSQNPTPTPSPVPTPPPVAVQSKPQKPQQSAHSQQDPLVYFTQAADEPSSPQVCAAPPTATGPAPVPSTPCTSLQPVQSHLEISDKEAEEKTLDDSEAAAPCVLVSHKDPAAAAAAAAAAPPQLIPLVNQFPAVEQPQTDSVNPQQSSSGSAPTHSESSRSWESSSSSCPTAGWSESLPPPSSSSSSYPATPPPLFPSPHFHTFLATPQPFPSYPPGYPPATPLWTLPTPQGATIPSLCSSASTSSIPSLIPSLIPKGWYTHQRKKKERSPHRGSTYSRSSSSRSNSKSSKSKSSRSYSRSLSRSRSRSRSRSQGRSRHHFPPSSHRNHRKSSHSSHSYSYGYKRSPTPSSSSSPRVGSSKSKSPSDHRKTSHHSQRHSKKSTSSSYSSRRRGERSHREEGGSEGSSAGNLYAHHASQASSLEMNREHYEQWKRQYEEWCKKYLNSYVSHFHHLPPPPLSLPYFHLPQWEKSEGRRNQSQENSESHHQLQGNNTGRMDGRVPPSSQSSSDSRSPPSKSSSDSRSTPTKSSSDSHATPSQSSGGSRSSSSYSSNDSRSPPSQSSSEGCSTPFKEEAETENTLKYEQKNMKKHEEGRGEKYLSPGAANSPDECRKGKRSHNTGLNTRKDGSPIRDKATTREALEPIQPLVKPDKCLDRDHRRKSREQRNLDTEKGWRKGKYSNSRQDLERQHKEKPSKRGERVHTDRYRNPEGSKASDSRSETKRKRKREDVERSSVKAQSSKCLKTKNAEVPKTNKSKSPNPCERKKPNMEKKNEKNTRPLAESDIWEGGIKVKPPKKISININLDGKRKEEETEKSDSTCFMSITGKTNEEMEKTGDGVEDKFTRGETEVNEEKEPSRNREDVSEERIKPDGEAGTKWEKATFREDEREMLKNKDFREMKEDRGEEEFDFWHCGLKGMEEEEKESEKQWNEQDSSSSCEDRQERKVVVKTLEEYTQDRAADREDELVLIQVPRSRWDKEESEEDGRNEGEIEVSSASVAVTTETPTARETEAEHEEQRQRETWRDREGEKNSALFSSQRIVAPSSGKDRPESSLSAKREGERERKVKMERPRDRERGRESDRQKETKTSKERTWEEEKGRDRERERGHGSSASVQRRNPSSSFHSCSYRTSSDAERRDRQRGDEQGSNKSSLSGGSGGTSRAAEQPDQNAHKTYRDMIQDLKFQDGNYSHSYPNPQVSSDNYRHLERPAGSLYSPPSLSLSWGKEREKLSSESSGGSELSKPRMSSPDGTFIQNFFRNESKVEKGEWKQNKVEKVKKEGKEERDNQDKMSGRGGGSQWQDEADKLEGKRPSSNNASSSASQESSSDDGREDWKKRLKKEKRQRATELLEEGERMKHKKKKSKKSRDGEEDESMREVADRWNEEEDHAKLYSLMFF